GNLFFFSSRSRHTIFSRDWSSDVCSSDLSLRYLVVNIPCAKGENTIEPTPFSSRASSNPSRSIQRLSIEYEGWWIRQGVPRSLSRARASRVRWELYEEIPT